MARELAVRFNDMYVAKATVTIEGRPDLENALKALQIDPEKVAFMLRKGD